MVLDTKMGLYCTWIVGKMEESALEHLLYESTLPYSFKFSILVRCASDLSKQTLRKKNLSIISKRREEIASLDIIPCEHLGR